MYTITNNFKLSMYGIEVYSINFNYYFILMCTLNLQDIKLMENRFVSGLQKNSGMFKK